jgi:hypothetical protein
MKAPTRRQRSTRRDPALGRLVLAAFVAGSGILGAGCYKPVIDDGGFKCAPSGKRCPDGLTCGSDGRCWQMPPPVTSDASDGKIMSDAGDGAAESMCALTVVMPSCSDAPKAGQTCNPACQTGCACGRCNVVGKATACVAAGTVKLGELCRLGTGDDCAPGLICRKETCGNGLARCYKHCTKSEQCGGSLCQLSIDDDANKPTGFTVCDVVPRTCDPILNMGCPAAALKCYLTGATDTLCDCPSNPTKPAQVGEACNFYNDCDGGLYCIGGGGDPTPRCRRVCDPTNASTCSASVACVPIGTNAKFGYCNG